MEPLLISFEGGECAGKNLQIELTEKRLIQFNPEYKILTNVQEPGSTLKAEIIRMLLKNKHDTNFPFPGDFIKTFNLEKYKIDFGNEKISNIAEEFLVNAFMTLENGVKYETMIFLVRNELPKEGVLRELIADLQKSDELTDTITPADLLLGKYFSKEVLSSESQLYLYLAARNIIYENRMIPELLDEESERKKYDIGILNRSGDSSVIYQGWAQNPDFQFIDFIRKQNTKAMREYFPDLTIFIDIPVEEIYRRKSSRHKARNDSGITKDFFDEKEEEFHERVRQGYLKEAEYYRSLPLGHPEKGRIKIVDGSGTPPEVHERIWDIVKEYVK